MHPNRLDRTCTKGRGREPMLRNPEIRMVKGSFLILHPPVGERDEKFDEQLFLNPAQTERFNPLIQVLVIETTEIPTAVEELHHLPKCGHSTVMEIGPSEFDVAQTRRLEGPIHRDALEQDSLTGVAHTIGIGICADRSISVLSRYVVVADDRKVDRQ